MWTFSKHSIERMAQRGYSKSEILMVLNEDVPSIIVESPKEATVDLYFAKVGEKYVLTVVDRDTHRVITIRPMRRKEKSEFEKEIRHET